MRLNFDTNKELENVGGFTSGPVPAGDYQFQITGVDQKVWSEHDIIELTLTIQGPTHQKRLIWMDYCMAGPTEKKVQIGRGNLARLTSALGIDQLRDSSQLLGKRFGATLGWSKPYQGGKQYPNLRDLVNLSTEAEGPTGALEAAASIFGADIETSTTVVLEGDEERPF